MKIPFGLQFGREECRFHGGFLGAATSIIIFSRLTDNGFFDLGDRIVVSVPIGLFFGRIANFINQELWGTPSELPWAMIFSNPLAGGVARHPSQLYKLVGRTNFVYRTNIHIKKGCRSGVLTAYFFVSLRYILDLQLNFLDSLILI